MTGPKSVAVSALLLLTVAGCVSVPSPDQVVRSCSREQVSIQGETRGSPRNYNERVEARCEDDELHRVATATERQGTEDMRSGAIQYEERDGEESTQVSVVGSSDGKTTKQQVRKKRETKNVIWGWESTVTINKPR